MGEAVCAQAFMKVEESGPSYDDGCMRPYPQIITALEEARHDRRCAIANSAKLQSAVHRREQTGELVCPLPHLFCETQSWARLTPSQQVQYMAKALRILDADLIFAGPTAAQLYGWEVPFSAHRRGLFTVCSSAHPASRASIVQLNKGAWRVIPIASDGEHIDERNGCHVTQAARTLVDCALLLPFVLALVVWDSAFRLTQVSATDVLRAGQRLRGARERIDRLLEYTDPRSDNGGESFTRAVMIEQGFQIPELQVWYPENGNSGAHRRIRVDFRWKIVGLDGSQRVVVGELDGREKYENPEMTHGRSAIHVAHDESQRERELYDCHVDTIVRFDFSEVKARQPFITKLMKAGIPRFYRGERNKRCAETVVFPHIDEVNE